ncbi:MAG: pitrilysin family protein [Candidatus Nanoarchaeia archaeon]|jgi:predicted Zn-dependent peptidase
MGKHKTLDFKYYTLDNGLIVAYKKTGNNTVSIDLNVGSGSLTEKDNEKGLCHLLEHCLYNGATAKYDVSQLSEIKSNFGYTNAFTAVKPICFSGEMLKEDAEIYLDFISQVAFNSRFDESTLNQEKERVLREISDRKINISSEHIQLFDKAFFGDLKNAYNVLGDEETVKNASVIDLNNIYGRNFNASNMGLFLYGGLPDNIENLIKTYFGGYPKGKRFMFNTQKYTPNPTESFLYFKVPYFLNKENPKLSSAELNLRVIAPNSDEKYFYEMQILNDILGNSYNCLLFNEISKKKGLAYNINSKFIESQYNFISISGMVSAMKYEEATSSIFDIFSKLRSELIPEDLLIKNIKSNKFQLSKIYESNQGNINMMKANIYDNFDINDVFDIMKNINSESIREAANIYLPENINDKKYTLMIRSPFDEK